MSESEREHTDFVDGPLEIEDDWEQIDDSSNLNLVDGPIQDGESEDKIAMDFGEGESLSTIEIAGSVRDSESQRQRGLKTHGAHFSFNLFIY